MAAGSAAWDLGNAGWNWYNSLAQAQATAMSEAKVLSEADSDFAISVPMVMAAGQFAYEH